MKLKNGLKYFCSCLALIGITGCYTHTYIAVPQDEIDLIPQENALAYIHEHRHFSQCVFLDNAVLSQDSTGETIAWPYSNYDFRYSITDFAFGYTFVVYVPRDGSVINDLTCTIFHGSSSVRALFGDQVRANWRPVKDFNEVSRMASAFESIGVRPSK